jgi:hypothetical protein
MVDSQGIPVSSMEYSNPPRGYAESAPGYSNSAGGYSHHPQSFTNAQSGIFTEFHGETSLADVRKKRGTPTVLRQLQAVEQIHLNPHI